ncbi:MULTISPECIES: LPS-assembly protein LptD [unclassified Variovorax]|uniref:LPS-assembly protein LptD n=1 Tax=unclassified Variovorax TaxID=663243 RepID=UPI00076C1463|nr:MULTISPECIES: LPS-assembly protein LptD [unclassified Variovorax]KWT82612.1 Outer membrane protein Imp, required for envelope biogenesis [Variovorax sp. WDL1]PNG58677.1 LPS-assembly protein LptD [Variovorax sp. B4]PNG61533.1 LPS-assembly protein LptD [Variovorax sp. B2]VTV12442.1 Organic solvent tolerance protein [Variovorax sp. WDL1]
MPDLTRADWRRCRPPLPLALLTLALLQAQAASAQDAGLDAPITLKRTPQLLETIPKTQRGELPTFVDGDRMSGRTDLETVVEGNASLRRGDTVIHADRLEYYQPEDLAKASGNVRVNQAGNVYEGPHLELKLETFEGFFNKVHYRFLASGGEGDAERIDFVDSNVSVARQGTYTTCRREDYPGWMPAWVLSAATLTTDTEENIGVATDARMSFMGITTPPFPSLSFPLSNDRKSGFLPPTVGVSSVNGVDITVPYYWNIAPNRDATFYPEIMGKRGVNLGSEFRYLERDYSGDVRVDYMPTDSLRNRKRWGIWTNHSQAFDPKPLGLDALSASIRFNRVSDDDYWRDFTRTPSLTTRLLSNDASLNWTKGDWNGIVRTLKYQTLQYDLSPIIPPYDRLPQITANYYKYDWNGFDFSLNTDYTRFRGDPVQQRQPNGERVYAQAALSRPFLTPGTYVIPKVQLHTTSYQFEAPLSNGANSASRTVPTFSLDSGMIFERDASFFGRAFRQTLEPRAFYVYTPYRDQSLLPNYDSAANDFNFATIYTENAFSGNDRISDSNTLTVGVTSRLIDPESGAEAARFGVAQRLRFKDQRVTLPGTTAVTDRVSDLLFGAQINWTPRWSVDGTVQYNPDDRKSTRTALSARYNPGPYRNISAAYRYQANSTPTVNDGNKSLDVSWQWPLNDLWGDKGKDLGPGRGQGGGRWYAVGRLNYSLQDRKLTDGVLGVEYDGCCWIGRVVLERLTTGQATANTRIMFQLEFVGFAAIGASPMRTLTQNIQRYQPLRQPFPAPSRFTNYD